jgi:hypothetical protein
MFVLSSEDRSAYGTMSLFGTSLPVSDDLSGGVAVRYTAHIWLIAAPDVVEALLGLLTEG